MATITRITIQQSVELNPSALVASKYPKFVVNLGTSITGVTVSELANAVQQTEANKNAAAASAAAALTSETNAKTSETKAKTSETNAKTSETNAKTSETNAKTSETKAKTSETNALASEVAARSSEVAASTSETNAKTSETNAKASEVAAKTSETNALTSEVAAKTSEVAAKTSETNALTSETNAKTSEINAKTSETKAKTSETKAKTSETNAKTSETNAKASETNAKTSETNAKTSEVAAKTSETNALASEVAARNSEVAATGSKDAAKASEINAKTSETNAKTSETNAKTSETNAKASEVAAAQSAAEATNTVNAVALPLPDVWAPLNDSMVLWCGSAPFDRIEIGTDYLELNSKSINFSRASTGTYIDKSGVLKTAAIDEPRFTKYGLLIEGSSTNYYLNTNDPSKWPSGAGITKTQSPDGDTQAVTSIYNFTADTTEFSVLANGDTELVTLAANAACTMSCRIKGTGARLRMRVIKSDGTFVSDAYLDLETGTIGARASANIKATAVLEKDGYYKFIGTFTAIEAANYIVQIRLIYRTTATTIPANSEIRIQMPQLESGYLATSYIPTVASTVTRAADDCYLQRSGNDNYFGPITIALEVQCLGQSLADGAPSNRRGIISIYPTTADYIVGVVANTNTTSGQLAFAYGDGNFLAGAPRIDDTLTHSIVLRGDTVNKSITIDGSIVGTTSITKPTPGATSSVNDFIYLGRGAGATAPGSRMLNGHIRNLRIWHSALTDNQIKGIR